VTGGAGFIGSHLCERLIERGEKVVALDSFDPFYPESVKRRNIQRLAGEDAFRLVEADIRDIDGMARGLEAARVGGVDAVVHLAARAGVRPSIDEPLLYSQTNVDGTVAVLEVARRLGARRFIFGSSSSVYGNSEEVPFAESNAVDHPISPYAATKRAGELLCHTYHHLFGLSIVCLRFFTVYGPRQRPDLAIHKFARLMREGRAIPMFGDGSTERDYTYVDDIVSGVMGAIRLTEATDPLWEIVNLGGSRTTSLSRLIALLSDAMGVEPSVERQPVQPGDVRRTFADVRRARELFGYEPSTPIEAGIPRFIDWFRADGA